MTFLLGTQLLRSTPSLATEYYVDANGGNDTYSGLASNEGFATLKHAMLQLQAGDTLYVRSGEYHDGIHLRSTDPYTGIKKYNSGTSTQPITVKAYQNEIPVIGTGASFHIEDLSWWVFEGLTFQSSYLKFGINDTNLTATTSQCRSTAENITIRGNRFQHGSNSQVAIACGRHLKIQNNIFDNLRSRKTGTDRTAVALSYYASDVVISGNHFIDIGADGVQLSSETQGAEYTDIVIMGNEFEIQRPYRYRDEDGNVVPENQQPFDNVGENAIDIKQGPGPILISKNIIHGFRHTTAGQDATGDPGNGIVVHNQAEGITFSKNHFYDNENHLVIFEGNNINPQPDVNTLIHNNIFGELVDPNTTGSIISTGLVVANVRNVEIFNNTFQSQYGDTVRLIAIAGSTDAIELLNNAFYNGGIAISDESQVNLVADYNAWAQVSATTGTGELYPSIIGANNIITDFLHIDSATWKPLENSPLIDAGSSIGIITSDFYESPIAGLGHDIGAVEFMPSQQNTDAAPDAAPPVALVTLPPDTVSVSDDGILTTSNPGTSNSGGGGCTVNTSAKLDPVWVLILIIPLTGRVRTLLRRKITSQR